MTPPIVDVELVTEAPVMAGGRVTAEGPGRLRLSVAAGALPGVYLDGINGLAVGEGWYTTTDAELISAALEDSFVLRTHLGWRPFERQGFFFAAGYGVVTLGGGLTGEEVLEAVLDMDFGLGGEVAWEAAATLHMLDTAVGWEFVVARHLVVKVELGSTFTLAADTRVEPEEWPTNPLLESFAEGVSDEAEDWLTTELETYVHTPTVGLGVGWRF